MDLNYGHKLGPYSQIFGLLLFLISKLDAVRKKRLNIFYFLVVHKYLR